MNIIMLPLLSMTMVGQRRMETNSKCADNFGLQDSDLRTLLSKLIRQSPKKRLQIAEEMTERTGQKISEDMLNDWTSECHKAARFPAAFIMAFCEVMDSDVLQRHVMGARLRGIIDFRDEQVAWLAGSLRAAIMKPNRRRKPKIPPPRKS